MIFSPEDTPGWKELYELHDRRLAAAAACGWVVLRDTWLEVPGSLRPALAHKLVALKAEAIGVDAKNMETP